MSEQAQETQQQPSQETQQETPEQTIAALRDALKKANGEAKDNRLKAQELDKIKSEQMSDLERTQGERDQAFREAAEARADAVRWRIAAANGISDEDAATFLTGADEETLTRQAARLAELRNSAPTLPKPDLTQGGSGGTPPALNSDGLEDALKFKLGIA